MVIGAIATRTQGGEGFRRCADVDGSGREIDEGA